MVVGIREEVVLVVVVVVMLREEVDVIFKELTSLLLESEGRGELTGVEVRELPEVKQSVVPD